MASLARAKPLGFLIAPPLVYGCRSRRRSGAAICVERLRPAR